MVVFLVTAPLQGRMGGDARLAMATPRLMCKKVKISRKQEGIYPKCLNICKNAKKCGKRSSFCIESGGSLNVNDKTPISDYSFMFSLPLRIG